MQVFQLVGLEGEGLAQALEQELVESFGRVGGVARPDEEFVERFVQQRQVNGLEGYGLGISHDTWLKKTRHRLNRGARYHSVILGVLTDTPLCPTFAVVE